MALLCGVDIGGTKLAAGLVSPEGGIVRLSTDTCHTCMDEAGLMDFIAGRVGDLCREQGIGVRDLGGVAVGMAGHMRSRDGVVLATSNLNGFRNYPLTAELSARLGGLRVTLENDANCQAWAEYKYGAGRGSSGDMVFVTVSTGIGAGIIIGGRLYRGRTGTAGEIGHAIVQPDSDIVCTCGNRGCFMALASTVNLDHIFRRKCGGSLPAEVRMDGRLVTECAEQGDPVALEIINEYADYLGILLYNIFQTFNPDVIVVGGGLVNWEFGYFERAQRKVHSLAGHMLHDPLEIVKAAAGPGAGVLGAAALLLETGSEMEDRKIMNSRFSPPAPCRRRR